MNMETSLRWVKVKQIRKSEPAESYDIWNREDDCWQGEPNFFLDNTLVHNSIPEAVANRDGKGGDWKGRLSDAHPALLDILKDTHGVICYQEQLQAIWQRVAGFTAPEAQEARKAVAKKWTHKLKSIEEKWMTGASRTLGKATAAEWWQRMTSFGRYAFNRCLGKYTILTDTKSNISATVEQWYDRIEWGDDTLTLKSYSDGGIVDDKCVAIHHNGEMEVFEIEFDNGQKEEVTMNHKFLCSDGEYHEVREIIQQGLDVTEVMSD